MNSNSTPKFWTTLFRRVCNNDFFEELQGDLEERYFYDYKVKGEIVAGQNYRKEVLKMLRPSVIKTTKMKRQFSFSIFKMHLVLTARNMKRNKVFSAVNVFSLAAAMTLCLFAVNMIYTGYSYDKQHINSERIYRVTNKATTPERTLNLASSPYALDRHLKEMPQIETSTFFLTNIFGSYDVKGETISIAGYSVDEYFFDVFNFKVIAGNPQDIFKDYSSIVITDKAAKRLFGNENPIGKKSNSGAVVKAVIESPDKISHLKFDFIHNVGFMGSRMSPEERQARLFNWGEYMNDHFNYFRLAENTSISDVNSLLTLYNNKIEESAGRNTKIELGTQRLSDIMFGPEFMIEMRPVHPQATLIALIIAITILIALAGFNYTNLSIARSLQRSKEIGIRKLTGSTKWQVISQFLTETTIFSLLALALAIFAYQLVLPSFENYIQEFSSLFSPSLNTEMLIWFGAFSILVGFAAGIFPALHFAKISPLLAINNRLKKSIASLPNMKKALVGIQVCVSTFSILFIALITHQKNEVLNADLGYETNGLMAVPINKIDLDIFTAELDKIPEVKSYTSSSMIPGTGNMNRRFMVSENKQDTFATLYGIADVNFHEVYTPKLKIGPGFTQGVPNEILVDEPFLKRINLPIGDAIGSTVQVMHYDLEEELKIVGVLEDFTFSGLTSRSNYPLAIRNKIDSLQTKYITLDIRSNNVPNTLRKIESGFSMSATDQIFNPIYVDDIIAKNYTAFYGMMHLMELTGAIIILIAVLGQFGIALFNAESRVKEIGIRKVLGANFSSLAQLFARNTLITLIVSALIAIPSVYFFFNESIVPQFAIELSLPIGVIIKGILVLWAAIIAIVVLQTWQTANLNPSESLHNE
ncbi:FtsX-like permease family protein [Roseivirga sp.]|uniref:FtsX-like permease family protein n=1 Tax=Roseivirga sp. TaxID=1964215 RepID=UPI003B8B6542